VKTAEPERFTIAELAARAGAKVPLIHHYRRLGLLPEPAAVAPNRFLYNQSHVQAIQLIRLLRERRHLPLEAIREMLPALMSSDEQAFRPEIWEGVIARHDEEAAPRMPRARLVAAARTEFSRRGFDAVTVEDICQECGVAKGSFYRHFASKEEVFLAAVESIADVVTGQLGRRRTTVRSVTQALEPYAPLILEAVTRALRGEPGHKTVAVKLLVRLARRCGPQTLHDAFFRLTQLNLAPG